jgi:GNAT superfamily N-acetyltransferase
MKAVQYKPAFDEAILKLLGDKAFKREIWNWQFFQNPFATNTDSLIVPVENGKVVGFNGSMPVRLKYKTGHTEAIWSCDTIVDPEHRGKGFGKVLFDEVQKKASIVLGFGISDAAAPILRRSGWRVNREVEEYYYQRKITGPRSILKKAVQRVLILRNVMRRPHVDSLDVSVIDAADAPVEIDALWEGVEGGYSKVVVRNYAYIKWKYGEHPLCKYRLIVVRDGGSLVAVGVFRRDRKKSRLVDYVGPSGDMRVKYLLIRRFADECSKSEMLNCVCTDTEFKRALACCGFRRFRGRPRFYVHSNRPDDQGSEEGWFLMAGDSDGDMLEGAEQSQTVERDGEARG